MNSKIRSVLQLFGKAVKRGAIGIIISSFFNKGVVFLTNVMVIRMLGKNEYGLFSYAYNIVTMLAIVSSLGLDTAMLQYCCEKRPKEEKYGIARSAIFMGLLSNSLFSICTIIVAVFVPLSMSDGKCLLIFLSFLLPFSFLLSCQKFALRAELENKRYSLLTNIASGAYFIASVGLILPFGVTGTVVGRYLGYFIPILVGVLFLKKDLPILKRAPRINRTLLLSFVKYGIVIALTNGVSELLYHIDIAAIAEVTNNADSIASYRSATVIPKALVSLPAIVMIFVYPYFAKNKDCPIWIKSNLIKLQVLVLPAATFVSGILIVFAPSMIRVLYGEEYLDSLESFRILSASFTISAAFQIVPGNILAMMGKIRINFITGCIGCALNIVFDIVLVKAFGSVGAAITTFVIVCINAIMNNIVIYVLLAKEKKKQKETIE